MLKNKRLKLPYSLFNHKPSTTIKSLLGNNVKIISYSTNDFITDDDCIIVDVTYNSPTLSTFPMYFVKDLKPTTPNSNKYVAKIKDNNVLITIDNISDYKKYIPIRIFNTDDIENYTLYQYHGRITKNPMNSLFSPTLEKCKFTVDAIEKLYDKPPIVKDVADNMMELRYKYYISKTPLIDSIKKINLVKKADEIKDNGEGYLIDWRELIKDKSYLRGVILIQPIRKPFVVLFVHLPIFVIEKETMDSITEFLEQDYINYLNYNALIVNEK